MSKEFEAKKQEIIQEIKELILIPLHPCTDLESELIEREGWISERIKQLQLPKPPTCSTCEHFTGRRCDLGITDRWLEADESFGCLHHSDYEVAK